MFFHQTLVFILMFNSESAHQIRERRQKGRRETSAIHILEKEQRAHDLGHIYWWALTGEPLEWHFSGGWPSEATGAVHEKWEFSGSHRRLLSWNL